MNKIRLLKILSKSMFAFLLVGGMVTPCLAYAQKPEIKQPRVEQYIRITDLETGEVERIEVSNPDIKMSRTGTDTFTCELNTDFSALIQNGNLRSASDSISQTVESDLEGHTGTVLIKYRDDGTFACLDFVSAGWSKDSGAVTVKNCSVNYGQILLTNSENGYYKMSYGYGVQLNTGFKLGKYGYNGSCILGANLNGKIGKKQIEVLNQVSF